MLKFFIEKLLTLGYKTITVEQTENYYTKTDNICKREIVEMLSAGIMTDENFWKSSSDSKFLLCIIQKENKFGLTFVDCMTQTFFFDEVTKLEDLKSIVYRMKPVEIVSMKSYLEYNTMIFIKNILNPVFSQMKHFILPIEEIFEQLQIFFNGK